MGDLCILATGGTIDKEHDPISEQLVLKGHSHIPSMLAEYRAREISHEVVMLKDSIELDLQDRRAIQEAILSRLENSIVITHGTSTMVETAQFLDGTVNKKTVVLTGAMRPFSLFRSDAGFNLGHAISAATLLESGVYISMNGQTFKANEVEKLVGQGIFVHK